MPRTRQGHCTPGTTGGTGPLGPQGYCTHRATVGTGPPWDGDHSGYGGTGGTVAPSGLQQAEAQAGWATPGTAQPPPATPHTTPRWTEDGAGPGSPYKHDLKGERWVSGGAGGRRKERE
jgi:hypothetical protein